MDDGDISKVWLPDDFGVFFWCFSHTHSGHNWEEKPPSSCCQASSHDLISPIEGNVNQQISAAADICSIIRSWTVNFPLSGQVPSCLCETTTVTGTRLMHEGKKKINTESVNSSVWGDSNSCGRGLVSFLSWVDDSAHEQHTVVRLLVDDEDEGSVDSQSRRRSGKRVYSASCSDVIAALINRHKRFLINLKT